MQEDTVIYVMVTCFAVLILAAILILGYGVNTIADDLIARKLRRRFKQELSDSLQKNSLTWSQVKIIAETNLLPRKEIDCVIKQLIADILSEKSNLKNEKIAELEDHLESYNKEEPFDGMPNDIRIHLERLRENSSVEYTQLEPLGNHIKELLKVNLKERKIQKACTYISLLLGAIGSIVGGYQIMIK